ncbi:GNAT family N-acetyltransferase [Sphingobacterium sp. LRF_L2]|uniref:GNAT family N-acetyltransferase n=1 Tax=Sphingobacterium sp. LRF_L2 TaxID=3369421 RepID=UPI003F62EE9C
MIERIAADRLADILPLFAAYRVFYKYEPDLDREQQFLHERLSNQESVIFAAFEEGRAVGFTQLYPKYSSGRMEKNWILNDLFVDPPARGKGVATQLIHAVMDFAKEKSATFVQLETQVNNVVAQKLYKKIGFQLQDPDTEFLIFKKVV